MKTTIMFCVIVLLLFAFMGAAFGGTEGISNTLFGTGAGNSLGDDDDFATFIGYRAGYHTIDGPESWHGKYNTFVGYYAGSSNTIGYFNTFLGYYAGSSNTAGYANTFLGIGAGSSNTTGYANTFLGINAGSSNSTGYENTFLGNVAGSSNTSGYGNIFLGRSAGSSNTTGYENNFLGNWAGSSNTTGYHNTFLGINAGHYNTTGNNNTFLGTQAGNSNNNGWFNTFVGSLAGSYNSNSDDNTFIGYAAGFDNTTGYQNTFIGRSAGANNINGSGNVSLGYYSGYDNTTGTSNTFLGSYAGYHNTIGNYNSFLGNGAGWSNTTGWFNTLMGYMAGSNNTTGSGNVFLGYRAGYFETGSNKLYIDNSDTSTPLIHGEFDTRSLTIYGNLEVIGPYQGLVYLSNTTDDNTAKVSRMVLNHYSNAELPVYLFGAASTVTDNFVAFGGGNTIGNAATQIDLFTAENNTTPVGTPRLTIINNGYVGIGTQDPLYPLQMASGAYVTTGGVWTNASSREYKDNIEVLSTEEALEAIKELSPVKFAYKKDMTEKHVGFIAEEVPELVSTKDRKGLSPMDIVAVLTKVVQEQQKIISTLSERVSELEKTFLPFP